MSRGFKLYLIPVVILLAVTLPHLEQGEFRRDTVRYAAIALHMCKDGSLLVPYLNPEKPFFNKPPLAFWIYGASLKTFGPRLAAARVPSILAAIGVLIFSMLSVRNLGTRREAVVSGIVLATTYEFFRRTREISLDFWQLFFVTAAVWLITIAIRSGARRPIILSGIPIGLALMCKPLVAFIVIPIFVVWLALTQRTKLIPWLVGTLLLAIVVAAPWHLYMAATFPHFLHRYFQHEVVERAQRPDQTTSIFFYVRENAQTYWPWMLGLGCAIYFRIKQPRKRSLQRDFTVLATVWVLISLVVLSVFADRKPNYALPLYPMLSWIVAWGICRIRWPRLRSWYEQGLPWLAPATIALGLVAAFAPIKFQEPPEKNWLALTEWIKANQIDAGELAYTHIDAVDVCYVYLKTGRWMRSLKSVQDRQPLVVTKIFEKAKAPPLDQIVFSSGPVYVLKQGGSASPKTMPK